MSPQVPSTLYTARPLNPATDWRYLALQKAALSQRRRGLSIPAYTIPTHERAIPMSRPGAVTFKGNPLTLVGEPVKVGQPAPSCTLHSFDVGGLKKTTPADLKGKPTIISVVPSLDTPVCQTQTKKFN